MSTTTPQPPTGYVTAKVIAKHFSVTDTTIYKWADAEKIPSLRFEGTVRFDFDAVCQAIEGGKWLPPENEQQT